LRLRFSQVRPERLSQPALIEYTLAFRNRFMPTRLQTVETATRLFDGALFPEGKPTVQSAWAGIYQCLLWYEELPKAVLGHQRLPHIIDANRLTKSQDRGPSAWQRHAINIEEYLAKHWAIPVGNVGNTVDLLMKSPGYAGLQRHNILGAAFAVLVKLSLQRFGNQDPRLSYELEVPGANAFPGIQIPTRSEKPSIDILVRKAGKNIGIISTKWSYRHDRVDDLTTECRAYKNAGAYTDTKLFYHIATNEFDPARTDKLIGDKCVDRVIHVHKELVTGVCKLNGRLKNLWDLVDLLEDSNNW
jgi:hypothetical protein